MIPRLYVTPDLAPQAVIAVDERAAHYLRNVMRRQIGDPVVVFNGRDGEYTAEITGLDKRAVQLRLTALKRMQDSVPDLWLCFAPLKKDAVDFLVEKATELGVAAFQPVFTRHTAAARLNLDRLEANAIEAAEQTERLTLPEIKAPVSLDQLLAAWPPARHLFVCAEAGPAVPMTDALHRFTTTPVKSNAWDNSAAGSKPDMAAKPEAWAILCGPEGGFARSELDQLSKLPFVTPVGLGPRILRADTAALAALAMFQAVLGDGMQRPPQSMTPIGQRD